MKTAVTDSNRQRRPSSHGRASLVREGDYGPVLVVDGPMRGHVVYYDDDENGMEGAVAICYAGVPFLSETLRIPRSHLRMTTMVHLPSQRFARLHPRRARELGIVVTR